MKKTNVFSLGEIKFTDIQKLNDYTEDGLKLFSKDLLKTSNGVIFGLNVTQTAGQTNKIDVGVGAIYINGLFGELEATSGSITLALPATGTRTYNVAARYEEVLDTPASGYVLLDVTTRIEQIQTNFTRKFGAIKVVTWDAAGAAPTEVSSGYVLIAAVACSTTAITSINNSAKTFAAAGVVNAIGNAADGFATSIGASTTPTANKLLPLNGSGDFNVGSGSVFATNLTLTGTLNVPTVVAGETVTIDDNIVLLNNNVTGTPTEDAGVEIKRGTSANSGLYWREATDSWEFIGGGLVVPASTINTTGTGGLDTQFQLDGRNVAAILPGYDGNVRTSTLFINTTGSTQAAAFPNLKLWGAVNIPQTARIVGELTLDASFINHLGGKWYSDATNMSVRVPTIGQFYVQKTDLSWATLNAGDIAANGFVSGVGIIGLGTLAAQPANSGFVGMRGNSTANSLDFIAPSTGPWRFIPANGTSYAAPVATISSAGALSLSAGLSATTGTFSGGSTAPLVVDRNVSPNGSLVGLSFRLRDFAGNTHDYAAVYGLIEDGSNPTEHGAFVVHTSRSGVLAERFRVDSLGNATLTAGLTATTGAFSSSVSAANLYLPAVDGASVWAKYGVTDYQILRNHNNGNVTVNAASGGLFLGWNTGTGIFIGNGSGGSTQAFWNTNGNLSIGYDTDQGYKLAVNGKVKIATGAIAGIVLDSRTTWANAGPYPVIRSTDAQEWIMLHNAHIPYLVNGANGFTGVTQGARIRYAGQQDAVNHWDAGICSDVGPDQFVVRRNGAGWNLKVTSTGVEVAGVLTAGDGTAGDKFRIGDDVIFADINTADTIQLKGVANNARAALKLGTTGPTITGESDGTFRSSGAIHEAGTSLVDKYADKASGSFNAFITGLTTSPFAVWYYSRSGGVVTITTFGVGGTSNSINMTATGLPVALRPARDTGLIPAYLKDNDILVTTGHVRVATDGTMFFSKNFSENNFTASNTKAVNSFTFTYQLN